MGVLSRNHNLGATSRAVKCAAPYNGLRILWEPNVPERLHTIDARHFLLRVKIDVGTNKD